MPAIITKNRSDLESSFHRPKIYEMLVTFSIGARRSHCDLCFLYELPTWTFLGPIRFPGLSYRSVKNEVFLKLRGVLPSNSCHEKDLLGLHCFWELKHRNIANIDHHPVKNIQKDDISTFLKRFRFDLLSEMDILRFSH